MNLKECWGCTAWIEMGFATQEKCAAAAARRALSERLFGLSDWNVIQRANNELEEGEVCGKNNANSATLSSSLP